jgi:hypothetical protein
VAGKLEPPFGDSTIVGNLAGWDLKGDLVIASVRHTRT